MFLLESECNNTSWCVHFIRWGNIVHPNSRTRIYSNIGKTATVGRKTIHYNKSIIGSIIITSDHKIPVGLIKNYILFAGIIVLFCCGISLSMQDSSSDSDERICIRHISYMLALTTSSSSSPSTTLS